MNNCPKNCPTQLLMTERHGVEIDYCPTCRGVWLDRGELDKIIDRAIEMEGRPSSAQQPAAPVAPAPPMPGTPQIPQAPVYPQQPVHPHQPAHPQQTYGHQAPGYYGSSDYNKKRRKKNFLSEIFDFD